MKILVTGGLGFISSNFILYLLKNHTRLKITNIDGEFLGSNRQNLQDLKNNKNYEYIKSNITPGQQKKIILMLGEDTIIL